MKAVAWAVVLIAISFSTSAQEDIKNRYANPPPASTPASETFVTQKELAATISSTADRLTHEFRMTQESNKFGEALILGILALLSLISALYFVSKTTHSATNVLTVSGLVLIVFGTIILVLLAPANEQLTAAVGILGAIVGYLFGSMEAREQREKGTVAPAGAPAVPAGEQR